MPRHPTEAKSHVLVLAASGRSVQKAAAAGVAFSTLPRAMKRTSMTTNRRRSRRTATEIQVTVFRVKRREASRSKGCLS
jgi:hypothetical protein